MEGKDITTFEEWEDIQRETEYEEMNWEEEQDGTEEQDLLF